MNSVKNILNSIQIYSLPTYNNYIFLHRPFMIQCNDFVDVHTLILISFYLSGPLWRGFWRWGLYGKEETESQQAQGAQNSEGT